MDAQLIAQRSSKVLFANALRGLAALSVVVSHYLGEFWVARPVVAQLTGASAPLPSSIASPFYVPFVVNIPFFNWGAFGVGLFFVISGFVIPFSLNRYDHLGFLAGRALRIVPTYIAGFAITIAAIALNCRSTGAFPYTTHQLLLHAIPGLRDLFGVPFIDGIVWTLEVEVKFYLIAACLMLPLRQGSKVVFLLPLLMLGALWALWRSQHLPQILVAMRFDLPLLCFMFVGVALNYRHRGLLTRWATALICASVLICTGAAFWLNGITAQLPSYVMALGVFTAAMAFPAFIENSRLLNRLADVSYPLYVVHGIAGYVLIAALIANGMSAGVAPFVVAPIALACACVLHWLVELPTQALGHKLANRLSKVSAASPSATGGEVYSLSPIDGGERLAG